VAEHTRHAFADARATLGSVPQRVILDAGCGNGESSVRLAAEHRGAWVVGVDKSAARLSVHAGRRLPANLLLVRAELADFWRLAARAGWRVERHLLLYPNPWPKARHLKRRWHAHPAFPDLLALGGELELRTNWPIYAREFAQALAIAGVPEPRLAAVTPEPGEAISPFERKYAASRHSLVGVRARIPDALSAALRSSLAQPSSTANA